MANSNDIYNRRFSIPPLGSDVSHKFAVDKVNPEFQRNALLWFLSHKGTWLESEFLRWFEEEGNKDTKFLDWLNYQSSLSGWMDQQREKGQ